jgi:hypothetical protein
MNHLHPAVSSFSRCLGFPMSLDAAFNGLVGENRKKEETGENAALPLDRTD